MPTTHNTPIRPRRNHLFRLVAGALGTTLLLVALCAAQIPEQYPKPLIHTPTNHPAARVLIVSVDGLHAFDLANHLTTHPGSTLAALSARGVTFTNAHAPWADPLAGLTSLVTGGTPISTGILSAERYDRTANPAPYRVNTIFEVAHQKIGATAWAASSQGSLDLLAGPSHKGLDLTFLAPPTPAGDQARVDATLHWLTNPTHPAPMLLGLSIVGLAALPAPAYTGPAGTPTPALTQAFDRVDSQLAAIVGTLKTAKLYDTTWIVIAGPSAQAIPDQAHRRLVSTAQLTAAVRPGTVTHITGGGIAMIWLADPTTTPAAVAALQTRAASLGIADILSGDRLALTLPRPAQDPRIPDIVLQPAPNVLFSPLTPTAGLTDADTHVALLISGAQLTGRTDPTPVPTTQLAPLLLRAFGMEKFDLDALHLEHTPALPGIF